MQLKLIFFLSNLIIESVHLSELKKIVGCPQRTKKTSVRVLNSYFFVYLNRC